MGNTYTVLNGAAPGANAAIPVPTGTAAKTHLQIATNATSQPIRVIEWWTEFNGSAVGTPITVELLRHTGGAQNTLTAYGTADITRAADPTGAPSSIQVGTALSGFGPSGAEVTPTSVVSIQTHFVPPSSGLYFQFPLGREPQVQVAAFLRIRTTATANVGCYAGVTWEE